MLPGVPLVTLLSLLHATPMAVPPGEAVVQRAFEKYRGKWFHSALYIQRTVLPADQRIETWYVAVQPPGRVRVDVAPAATGRVVIYRNDTTYEIGGGRLRSATEGVLPFLLVLHDLQTAKPEQTIAMLRRYGFDLTRTHNTTWDGAPVIVVGALAGDTVSNQFWLDRDRLVLVRMIEKNMDPRRPLDARVTGYKPADGGWLPRSVRVYLGNDLSIAEDYSEPKLDIPLELDLFEPMPYHLPKWVGPLKDVFGHTPNVNVPKP
ncbi:MAG TPA: hypothetical protein VGL65_08630 [Gemmatimonadales bacterium]|jgi:hypothetical protein